MMAAKDEEAVLRRTVILAEARRMCVAWAYWALRTNIRTGYEPFMNTGGVERYYNNKARWQYETPPARFPDADENTGLAIQKCFAATDGRGNVLMPDLYRRILRAEFCVRPFIVPLKEGEVEAMIAHRARVSVGAYSVTLERALLALANIMKRKGLWRE